MGLNEAISALRHYRSNPVGFAIDCMGFIPQRWQEVALKVVADPSTDRFGVKACVSPGKTALDAIILWWFLCTHFPAKVPCTAPTQPHLVDKLWPEIDKWFGNAKIPLSDYFEVQKTRVILKEAPLQHFAVGRVSRVTVSPSGGIEAYGLQGWHGKYILVIIDESGAVLDTYYDTLEGVHAESEEEGRRVIVATGNPNIPGTWFNRAFTRDRELWRTMSIDYTRTTNVKNAWAEKMIKRYGEQSDWVQIRLKANFPRTIAGGLIALQDWEQCMGKHQRKRVIGSDPFAKRVLAIDVAGEGNNNNVFTRTEGLAILSQSAAGGLNEEELFDHTVDEIEAWNPTDVVVDADGGYGSGLCRRISSWIMENKLKINLIRWHGSAAAIDRRQFLNARAELGWKIKLAVEQGLVYCFHDQRLEAQVTTIKWERTTSHGKVLKKLEDKKAFMRRVKKEGGSSSCDELDSAFLSLVPTLYAAGEIPQPAKKERKIRYPKRHERLFDEVIL